ncbi:N-formylglutamate amidohydrolase [Ruegeria marisrubri]|uniref:N-formylglutamate amidohydrolase n=1 Tax=Ruegeria marisrubri TaxID=1685379 RepID=A0A0X3TEY3_9RHOB|nr:N-formylglutamate amidohydrolase [Ruegeria marisrubri]KUJ73621.1 N-formylglutamate amidohydrolase [Ruegeria marisrubri]
MQNAAYHISLPARRTSCVVFSSPHSGRDYPAEFLQRSVLGRHAIRSSEDAFVDMLFEPAAEYGAPLLKSAVPRAYLDLNRAAEELDPALIEGARRNGHNPRVASGLGVIPRVVANGRAIYRGKLPMAEAQRRIETYWHPYHARLQSLLDESRRQFGQAILVDCHSMPREAVAGLTRNRSARPEIVLGDRFGASASAEIVDRIEAAFAAAGLTVSRNAPFAGAYVTQTYGRPSRHQHAVQIEIDRSLYIDEAKIEPNENFETFRRVLRAVIAEIAAIGQDRVQLAAE